jgi:hypothetical protein
MTMGEQAWEEVEIRVAGRAHRGPWRVANGVVEVLTPHGSKASPAGQSAPQMVAQVLLAELAEEGKA